MSQNRSNRLSVKLISSNYLPTRKFQAITKKHLLEYQLFIMHYSQVWLNFRKHKWVWLGTKLSNKLLKNSPKKILMLKINRIWSNISWNTIISIPALVMSFQMIGHSANFRTKAMLTKTLTCTFKLWVKIPRSRERRCAIFWAIQCMMLFA